MFPQRLKEEREKRGYTMEELADSYNLKFDGRLNKSTISRYENGKQEPMISVVINFASLFGVSMDYMSGKTDISNTISFSKEPHIEKYNNLSSNNQQTVNNLIDDLQELEQLRQDAKKKATNQTMLAAFGGDNKIHESDDDELERIRKAKEESNQ